MSFNLKIFVSVIFFFASIQKLSAQMHTSYVFKPGVWLAVSVGHSALGETIVNGEEQDDLQKTSKYRAVSAYRFSRHSMLKFGITSGITTRYGADFTSILVAYKYMWFNKLKD